MSSNIHIPKKCQHCDGMFVAKTTVTKYCSHKCASRAYKKRAKDAKIQDSLTELANPQTLQTSTSISLKDKEFLSVKEAAHLIGASRWTIQRLIQKGELNHAKIGRRTIIQRNDINNLFNKSI